MRISSVPPPQHPTIQARPLWSSERVPSGRTAQRLCDLVAIATAAAFVLPVDELRVATRRTPYVAFARQSAMYLAHVSFGLLRRRWRGVRTRPHHGRAGLPTG
jgi:hypothetical protein